ncbi:arylesterase [Parasulfuritortus cantonensis]|uniref:Arylesterase n=1 Tax=Parasulfuritortus cantonensis TaxID=2528202 RepID=A0A4R1B8X6_9PROT|nr:arylesterase [Parasulfuritortus cantonensis]TCJ13425.1 arylesterase [Parasulfuritortus cantonensis]
MRILFACLFLLLAVPAAAASTVLVYGDSLSAAYGIPRQSGWVALLERRLAERTPAWRLVDASVSGETTAGGRARLAAVLARHRPDVVVLELGANDGLRGLPLDLAAANLKAMAAAARRAGARVLLVGMQLPPNYGIAYAREFRALYPRLAERERLALVPFLLDGLATRPELFQADGLHPTAEAQPRLLENVWAGLAPMLAGRAAR